MLVKFFHNNIIIHRLRLNINGKDQVIGIDDLIPCQEEDKMPVFCGYIVDDERRLKVMWPLLVEKAMSKAYGGYGCLQGGSIDSGFMDLTGSAARLVRFSHSQHTMETPKLFELIMYFVAHNCLLGAGTPSEENLRFTCKKNENKSIIIPLHAYSILDAISIDGIKLILMKNPWGDKIVCGSIRKWEGEYKQDSKMWLNNYRLKMEIYERHFKKGWCKEQSKRDLERMAYAGIPLDEGRFWVTLEEFTQNFSYLYACELFNENIYKYECIQGEWTKECSGGCSWFEDFSKNPHYILRVDANKQTRIVIVRNVNNF